MTKKPSIQDQNSNDRLDRPVTIKGGSRKNARRNSPAATSGKSRSAGKPRAPVPARMEIFEFFEQHGSWRIVRSSTRRTFLVSWYDPHTKQVRRRKLGTKSAAEATKKVEQLVKDGVVGDPKDALAKKPMTYVADALDYYFEEHASSIRSSEAASIAIERFLKPQFGQVRIATLIASDVRKYEKSLIAEEYALSYVSRITSVLRASLNLAARNGKIASVPNITEIRGREEMEAEPLRGRILMVEETARFFDSIVEKHFLDYMIAELNTGGARPEAVLEALTSGIDWEYRLFRLNPPKRIQTAKYRPIVKITATWEPWLRIAPKGPIVTYNGKPVKSIKSAMRSTIKRAKLEGSVNSTSIRHTIGRYLETARVPDFERSILLGHISTSKKKSTRRYSPEDPYHFEYLMHATVAIEDFVKQVNALTKKWDLERPGVVKPGWKKP